MPNISSGRYMVLEIEQVIRELKNRVLEFLYIRWDGQQATQRVTLNNHYIKGVPIFDQQTGDNRARFLNDALNEGWDKNDPPTPKLVLHCWDVEAGRWTSIPSWTVLSLNYMNW